MKVLTVESDLPDPADAPANRLTNIPSTPPANGCILNMNAIIEQCGGDRMFAYGIIERFREQAPLEIKRLDDGLEARDVEGFRRAAHTVKSMAAYVGANVAVEQCGKLEELAKADRLDGASPLVMALHHEIESIIEWITLNSNAAEQVVA